MNGETLNDIGTIAISGATKKNQQHKEINKHNNKFFELELRKLVMPYLS